MGTLVELESPVEPLRRELRERFGLEVSVDEADAALRAEIAFYRAHHDEGSDRGRLEDLRSRAAGALRDALPGSAHALPLAALTEALLAALRFRPYDEVPEVLRALCERGVRLVVVSNWDVSLRDVLRETGVAPLLDGVVISAEVGSGKPSRTIFTRALKLAGVDAKQALHVGDSVAHDVAGALMAGIEPLLVVREGTTPDGRLPPGVRTIESLRPLLRILNP
jgi:putative hydrolase of the HAD superfamily